ncbi:YsnF/AvaK domain-containing protein [Nocardiopsis sediminis]|uniref:YsnF/AvaK domain-containing protein n=1 Tax=Nocardiopsis sediminis TaxID=1778267 RepID=A0ABV8FMG9_9ACTN
MAPQRTAQEFIGHRLLDREGHSVGKIEQVYFDDETDSPKWVSVQIGMLGHRHSFVPLQGARISEEDLSVPFDKETIKDAPQFDAEQHLSMDEENRLYEHYGVKVPGPRASVEGDIFTAPAGAADAGTEADAEAGGGTGTAPASSDIADRQRMDTDMDMGIGAADAESGMDNAEDVTVIRSEERAHIGVESTESGRAHVRKTVESEHFQQDVPVSHEELRVEHVPLSDADRAASESGRIEEEDDEFVLHAEKPVISRETVPVEKLRISKETVTEEESVEGDLRKERIDVERDMEPGMEDSGERRDDRPGPPPPPPGP